jgi:hypothetical protein
MVTLGFSSSKRALKCSTVWARLVEWCCQWTSVIGSGVPGSTAFFWPAQFEHLATAQLGTNAVHSFSLLVCANWISEMMGYRVADNRHMDYNTTISHGLQPFFG